jgi:hypothetical protein
MFNKLLSFTKKVQDLPDQPALTPSDLKAQFDAAPDELRQYFNNFIDALMQTTSGDSGAKNVGATTVGNMTGNDVQTILAALDTRLTAREATQTTLWNGTPKYPIAADTITPSKPLSACRTGWILVWSDYDFGVGSNNFDWNFTYIPKIFPSLSAGSCLFAVANNSSPTAVGITVKRLLITDSTIVGDDANNVSATDTQDVCLRYVLEY